MRANYPFNCWYVAATSDELGNRPLARQLLGIPVVLYRRGSGEVVAMEDRCAHRAYPLSAGHCAGDRLVCGYHGFGYDPDGLLVDVPSQESVPPDVRVRTFATLEQASFVWVWLGRPGAAALRPAPTPPWSAAGWASTGESTHIEANYLLLHEHYLDLTNVFLMHPEAVPPGLHSLPPLDEVEVSERSVSYRRVLPSARLAEWEALATGLPPDVEYARREEGEFVSPALHVQRYAIDPGDGAPRELLRVQGFTPESPTSTHVFLQLARNFALDRDDVAEQLRAMFHRMAQRDADVLTVVQRRLGDQEPRRDINVKADRAAVRARRIVEEMVDEEAGRQA